MTKELDTKAIREALAKATQTPWRVETEHDLWKAIKSGHGMRHTMVADCVNRRDAELIANAPTWLQQLLDENTQLQADKAVAVEALRWYADLSNYMPPKPFCMPFIEVDKGEKAIRALERIESGEKG